MVFLLSWSCFIHDAFVMLCNCIQGSSHTFSEAVGKNVANPTAMLLSSCNMLNHVGLEYYGNMIQSAVERVLKVGKVIYRNPRW
jgi:isocitrate/isopropylmalate dehydrogenase